MIELKSDGELAAMRGAGTLVAGVLAAVSAHATPGVRLSELDDLAAGMTADAGAVPAFLGYHPDFAPRPYPAVLCTSVNDAVVHGTPSTRELRDGDLLSVDFAAHLDGWCADAAVSVLVGDGSPQDATLIETANLALAAGIAASVSGATLGDIGSAIAAVGRGAGYGLLAGHGGHGIGRAMHEAPHVPNAGRPGRGFRLRPGIALAIEPMLLAGGADDYRVDADGWTLRSADGGRAAHVEHTVAVTENGPWILTAA